MLRAVSVLALAACLSTGAAAHDWYDGDCCSNEDCAPIPSSSVTASPGGYHVRLRAEQHPMSPGGGEWFIPSIVVGAPNKNIRRSRDDRYHACILPASQTLFCLYVPEGDS